MSANPLWNDPGAWLAIGVSVLFVVVALVMHQVIKKVLKGEAAQGAASKDQAPKAEEPPQA